MNKIILNEEEYSVERCGIIPYCKINDNEYKFLLGLKSNYGKYYGDFGGGIRKKESYIDGLIREVIEESSTLIFKDGLSIIKQIVTSKLIFHQTKNKFIKTLFIEFLVEIPFSKHYITDFPNYNLFHEHFEVRWIDVKKVGDEFIINLNIKEELDGSLKPLINQILTSLKMNS